MDQSEVSGGWTSIYQLFWCILVFTEGTKVSKAIILFAFLGPCKYAVRWRKNRCLQRGSCKSLPRCRPVGRLAQDFQVAQFQVRASEFFGTSIALSPQLSSQLQRCYGKKDKTASRWFKQIPGILPDIEVKSWFTKRERESAGMMGRKWNKAGSRRLVHGQHCQYQLLKQCWNMLEYEKRPSSPKPSNASRRCSRTCPPRSRCWLTDVKLNGCCLKIVWCSLMKLMNGTIENSWSLSTDDIWWNLMWWLIIMINWWLIIIFRLKSLNRQLWEICESGFMFLWSGKVGWLSIIFHSWIGVSWGVEGAVWR